MSEVKWIKICTDIFDDEKILLIESMPEADSIIVCWFKLLTLAGKMNNSGVFMLNDRIAYTDEMLASVFRRPLNTVRMALQTFEQFGMVELINNVVTIPNWEKHQSEDRLTKLREYQRDYKRKQRKQLAEKSCQVDSQVDVHTLDIDKELDKETDNIKPLDNSIDNKKKNNTKKGVFQEFAGDDVVLLDALKEYDQHRKLIKHPMTDGAKKRLITRLQNFPREQWVAILHQSIDKGWQDIYELKEGENNGTRQNKPVHRNDSQDSGSSGKYNIKYSNED